MLSLLNILYAENPEFVNCTYFLMDNLSVHYSKLFRKMLKDSSIKIIYTSPYSPEINPIELFFNNNSNNNMNNNNGRKTLAFSVKE